MNQIDLVNQVALVSAASNGIGLEIALVLAKSNAKVYIATRNEQKVQKIKEKHQDLKLEFVYFDATKQETYTSCIKEVYEKENRLDILVNNYGGTDTKVDKTIFDTNINDYLKIANQNIATTYVLSQTAINIKKPEQKLSIINISSIGGKVPDIARIAYSTSKATINALTQTIALQAARNNIRCNAIMPGMINTDAVKNNLPEQFKTIFLKNVPLNKIGETSDIANLVLFLASDLSQYITGQTIAVSGGFGLGSPLYSWFNK